VKAGKPSELRIIEVAMSRCGTYFGGFADS